MSLVKEWRKVFSTSKKIAFADLLTILYFFPKLRNQFTYKGVEKKDKEVLSFIEKNHKEIIEKLKKEKSHGDEKGEKVVWILWWQGLDKAPEIVKLCINSVKKQFPDFEIKIIDKDNYSSYIEVPKFILEKVDKKIISITTFSDIIRASLLEKYGGLWLDSTLFFSNSGYECDLAGKDLYTVREMNEDVLYWPNKGRWNIYFLYSGFKKNRLYSLIKECFFDLFRKYDYLPEYFYVDYLVWTAYNNFPEVKEAFSKVPRSCEMLDRLNSELDNEYEKKKLDSVLKLNWVSKFNRRIEHKKEIDKRLTNYGFLVEEAKCL